MAKKPAAPKTAKGAAPTDTNTPERLAKTWQGKLISSHKVYDAWAKKYRVDTLYDYYLGHQWRGLTDYEKAQKYTVNLTFATIETQTPTLMFSKPKVACEARPDHTDQPNSDAAGRATLIQQMLQTFIDDRKLHLKAEVSLALHDAYSHFAVVEVGYTADWIDNPSADKPVLTDKNEAMTDSDGTPLKAPKKLLRHGSESLYIKRLNPADFRVSPTGGLLLEQRDWVAYAEWHFVEDIKANPQYQHTADLKPGGMYLHADGEASSTEDEHDRERHFGQVRIWKIYDLRKKVRHVLAEGHKSLLQQDRPFTTLPYIAMKFYEIKNSWYPLPPIYNWVSPQDEINESREMQRVHRRRANRRYMRLPSVQATEFEKLETGEDMVCIEVPSMSPPPIQPIQDAPLDGGTWNELAASKEDFQQITGVSGEARGIPESDTATQANIINVRAQLRESYARGQVADWLGDICRTMLLVVREKMQQPFMVKASVDPFAAPSPARAAQLATEWKQIKVEDVADLDVDITIDVASLSPVTEQAHRDAWNVVLQLMTNQALLMILMTDNPDAPNEPSPMLRKTLTLNGIKSESEIREVWRVGKQALQTMMLMQAAAAVAKTGGPAPPMGMPPAAPGGTSVPAPGGESTGQPTATPLMT